MAGDVVAISSRSRRRRLRQTPADGDLKGLLETVRGCPTIATATSVHSPDLNPIDSLRQVQALVAQGRRALGRNNLRHNRRNPSFTPNAPPISETQAMPNPKSIMH
jgi:hypothetical protein